MATRTTTEAPRHTKRLVRNRSSRLGMPVQAVAVHSTESQDRHGTRDDLDGVYSWFNNPASQASSHISIDGEANTDLWVPSVEKAWTILQLNPVTCNIEFIGRAAQPREAWEDVQIKEGAKWAAYWGKKFDIPMQRGVVRKVAGAPVITKKGIITHKQLTDAGFGSHTDPGPQFPIDRFINLAQWYRRRGWLL